MKFLTNFIVIFLLIYVFLFFGGWFLVEHFWGILAICAFVLAVILSIIFSQDEKIEQLEKRIKELEEKENT